MKNEKPFDIPAINNQKAALMLHLGLDGDSDSDWDSVKEVEQSGLSSATTAVTKPVRLFEHRDVRYCVAHASFGMEGHALVAFNSNHWTIEKVPTSTAWPINEPTELPATMRRAHGYDYLDNELNGMWLDGLAVAHQLLERHEEDHGHATYYQDSFGSGYIAALADPRIGAGVGIVYDEVANPAHSHLPRKEQPSWQAFEEARLGLKLAPRGSIALLRADDRWHIRIHAGGGHVSDCKTMRSTGPKPTAREIQECVLSYEAFLARKHAEKEREILRNFARLRELKLQPGHTLRDVQLQHNGKTSKMTFRIQSISDSGFLSLVDGTLRGARGRFTATVAASRIEASQIQAPAPKKVAAPVDHDTAPLF